MYGPPSTLYSLVSPKAAGGIPEIDVIVPLVPLEQVVFTVIFAVLKSSNNTKFVVPEAGVGLPVPHPKNPEEFATNLYDMVWHPLLSEVGIVELNAPPLILYS